MHVFVHLLVSRRWRMSLNICCLVQLMKFHVRLSACRCDLLIILTRGGNLLKFFVEQKFAIASFPYGEHFFMISYEKTFAYDSHSTLRNGICRALSHKVEIETAYSRSHLQIVNDICFEYFFK